MKSVFRSQSEYFREPVSRAPLRPSGGESNVRVSSRASCSRFVQGGPAEIACIFSLSALILRAGIKTNAYQNR